MRKLSKTNHSLCTTTNYFGTGLSFAFALVAGCSSLAYEKSDHFDGKKFFNPSGTKTKSFADLVKWRIEASRAEWPEWVENKAKPNLPAAIQDGEAHLTFVNHATYLIQVRGLTVLTDPVFSGRASPVQWAGPKRVRKPGLALDELPKIDLILVSHNHYDHLDLASLKRLSEKYRPLILTPLANKKLMESSGVQNVVELDWWQSLHMPTTLGGQANERALSKATLVPAQHWSARGLFDRNEALWGGFVLEAAGMKIYFAGDSGYGSVYQEIAARVKDIDVSLLPIGAYEPRWFMKDQHMNPEEAVRAHKELKSRLAIGIHYGTFQLTDEGIDEPVTALKQALVEGGVPASEFIAPETGTTSIYRKRSE